ncbi:hypothetical protein EVAR_20637_1 [Eumeta japonica]|uniref:Uncharacterized protein n=1 Tax=Eumeta variegata TaxID=151549 RepID=A0A4C1VAV2_EUMVA|nr:hypothetical protein EVAR_20637_1 [Eumeta japonica]
MGEGSKSTRQWGVRGERGISLGAVWSPTQCKRQVVRIQPACIALELTPAAFPWWRALTKSKRALSNDALGERIAASMQRSLWHLGEFIVLVLLARERVYLGIRMRSRFKKNTINEKLKLEDRHRAWHSPEMLTVLDGKAPVMEMVVMRNFLRRTVKLWNDLPSTMFPIKNKNGSSMKVPILF